WSGDYRVTASGEVRFRETPRPGTTGGTTTNNANDGFWSVQRLDGTQFRERTNADGSTTRRMADRSTVEIDRDGLVRKVSMSQHDYRTFDYVNGQLSRVSDYRQGRQPQVREIGND